MHQGDARRFIGAIEQFEQRMVFSIAPVDPLADGTPELAALIPPAAPQPPPLTSLTDFNVIRSAYGFTGAGQTVVVIDSGIAYTHPALGGGLGAGLRVVGGWDFAEGDAHPYDDGPAGAHGTHVAGIIGSGDPKHLGAAPGVDLVGLRVFDDNGNSDFSWINDALNWVHLHRNDYEYPITTVNISIGTDWNASTVPNWATLEANLARLEADGIFISVAAGNSFATYNAAGLSYPAASSFVVPVASVDGSGNLSYFSQRDDRVIAAPGQNIVSTVPDYLGNRNGIDDDFQSLSGTSMAAPFVAGASVLIREALQFAGVGTITEDSIYNIMRNTADSVYDAATNHSYHRLNIGRAINSIMPTDDYGSTETTSGLLGTVASTATFAGTIGRTDDRDWFRFTAGTTGLASFTIDAGEHLTPVWRLVGSAQSGAGATFGFSVVAGQSYTIDLGTAGGIGHYRVSGEITGQSVDWGTIALAQIVGQNINVNNDDFTFQASRTGILSIEVAATGAGGAITFDAYDSAGRLLGSSTATATGQRLDINAEAGQVFSVHTHGANTQATFRLANLVTFSGDTATIAGTAGDDRLEFAAGTTGQIKINGFNYAFDSRTIRHVRFDGGAGHNSVTVTGTTGFDAATLRVGSVEVTGVQYQFSAANVQSITVNGGGGADSATLYDSAGNDTLAASPLSVRFFGSDFVHNVLGFKNVTVNGGHGSDQATLYDSVGNDTLTALPTTVSLQGPGYQNVANRFARVQVIGSRGIDRAVLFDSADDDTLTARGMQVELQGTGYDNLVTGFTRTRVYSTAGNDVARLDGSQGNDTLTAWSDRVQIIGPGFDTSAIGFSRVQVDGGGGNDTARLYDSAGADTLVAKPGDVELSGAGFDNRVTGFAQVRSYSSGGNDRAMFYDSVGDDRLTARADSLQLVGQGFDNAAYGFKQTKAFASKGNDRVNMYTGSGDNSFQASGGSARLIGNVFDNFVFGFDEVCLEINAGQISRSQLSAVDYLFQSIGDSPLPPPLKTR